MSRRKGDADLRRRVIQKLLSDRMEGSQNPPTPSVRPLTAPKRKVTV